MTGLFQHVEQSIQNRKLLKPGQAVLVAVSGGLDSMTLLHALHALSSRHRWNLTVAHFNHRLRGRSSDADEKLVRRMAARLKLPVVVGRAQVKAFAKKSKLSLEMAARKLRHEFLARVARQRNIRVVALAHHADDQVELFFLRLLRGAGGEGLAGMKSHSPSPADQKIRLIRPLLDTTREELRQGAEENKIPFREDATNARLEMPRNRVRNELLPLLRRRHQPALTKTVLRLMKIIGAEAELVGEIARQWLVSKRMIERALRSGPAPEPCSRPALRDQSAHYESNESQRRLTSAATGEGLVFNDLPVAVQRRVLQQQLVKLRVPAEFDLVEQLRKSAGVQISVGAGLFVWREASGRLGLRAEVSAEFNVQEKTLKLAGRAGSAKLDGVRLDWRFEAGARFVRSQVQKQCEFFDADRVGCEITLRHWRPGDRFQPIGLRTAVKLQDLFTNRKIPRTRRHELIVAEAEDGEIFWVENLRMGDHFKLTRHTRRRLVWRWQRAGLKKTH